MGKTRFVNMVHNCKIATAVNSKAVSDVFFVHGFLLPIVVRETVYFRKKLEE